MNPKFVLAWITSIHEEENSLINGGSVVFVRHPERGWEIPGGHIIEGETPEQALHREIIEETKLTGEIISWNKEYYPEGWVAHMRSNEIPKSTSWSVDDHNVSEIRWWQEVPPVIMWTTQEFIDLDKWFNSKSN